MKSNLTGIIERLKTQTWAQGDKAIVLVSSVSATTPAMTQSLAYNLSKSALNQLARHYARSQPIRINTVSPDTFSGDNPAVYPSEVADVIAFLCSPQSSGINGQDIRVSR